MSEHDDELDRLGRAVGERWAALEVPEGARERAEQRVLGGERTPARRRRRWLAGLPAGRRSHAGRDPQAGRLPGRRRRLAGLLAGCVAAGAVATVLLLVLAGDSGRIGPAEIVDRAAAALSPRDRIVQTTARFDSRAGATRLRGTLTGFYDPRTGANHLVVTNRQGRLALDLATRPGLVEAYTAPDDTITVTRVPRGEVRPGTGLGQGILSLDALRERLRGAQVRGPVTVAGRRVYELRTTVDGARVRYTVDARTFRPVALTSRTGPAVARLRFTAFRTLDRTAAARSLRLLPHPGARRRAGP